MFKQDATLNSRLHNLMIYPSQGRRKASQKMNYMYAATKANTAVLAKYSNFQQKISLQIKGFCFDW